MRISLWKLLNISFYSFYDAKHKFPRWKLVHIKFSLFFSTPPSYLNGTEASPKKARHNDWGYLFQASFLISSLIIAYLTSKPTLFGEQESSTFFIFWNPSTNFTRRSQLVQGKKQLIKVEPQKQLILLNYSNK